MPDIAWSQPTPQKLASAIAITWPILLSGSRFSPAKQPAKIDGRQPGASNPPRRSRHRESPCRLRTGYGSEYAGALAPSRIVVHPIGRVGVRWDQAAFDRAAIDDRRKAAID